jgi:acetyl-CoA carboxylase biotin carboxyl carrier protein
MDTNLIRRLVKLVETSGISELEIEEKDFRVYISKYPQSAPGPAGYNLTTVQQPPAVLHSAPQVVATAEGKPLELSEKLHEIKSPIVGTFYRSPAPDADSYVKVGDRVEVGAVLCIVEAMKLMNEIESDTSGIVAKILIENGKPVEYGQPLFLIKSDN